LFIGGFPDYRKGEVLAGQRRQRLLGHNDFPRAEQTPRKVGREKPYRLILSVAVRKLDDNHAIFSPGNACLSTTCHGALPDSRYLYEPLISLLAENKMFRNHHQPNALARSRKPAFCFPALLKCPDEP
jgi:hypothetical protein